MTEQSDSDERDKVEVLISEFLQLRRDGQPISVDEFAASHPEYSQELTELLPMVVATEESAETANDSAGITPAGTAILNENEITSASSSRFGGLKAGIQLGKYRLIRQLGQGGMGSVWLSEHPSLGVPLAVKVLRPDFAGRAEGYLERFLREGRTAALINHPNIVRVYDADCENGYYYIAMEFVEGGSVGDLLRQQEDGLAAPRAVGIAIAIAEALEAAASQGIVHRDIKPDNIMLDRSGTPKLADLGLARSLLANDELNLTTSGIGLGTPHYVAPEQAMGTDVPDVTADIYSLGATLYHLVAGETPFSGKTPYQVIHEHVTSPIPNPRKINPRVSSGLARVITKAMAKKPAERYQSMESFRRALLDLSGIPETRKKAQSGLHWIYGGIAALLLAGVLTSVMLYLGRERSGQGKSGAREDTEAQPEPGAGGQPNAANHLVLGSSWNAGLLGEVPLDIPPAARFSATSPMKWSFVDNSDPGVPKVRGLRASEYTEEDGGFAVVWPQEGQELRLHAEAGTMHGLVSIAVEMKGVSSFGFIDKAFQTQTFAPPKEQLGPNKADSWHKIQILRQHRRTRCLVNGVEVPGAGEVDLESFYFWVKGQPGKTCHVRYFHGASLPPPASAGRPGGGNPPGREEMQPVRRRPPSAGPGTPSRP